MTLSHSHLLFLRLAELLPPVTPDGDRHGKLADCLVQNSGPRADDDIINDPQRGVDQHAGKPDLARIVRVTADGGGDVRGHWQQRQPARPREDQRRDLHQADDDAHLCSLRKLPPAAETDRAEGVDDVADRPGDRAEQKQMHGVKQIGQKLHAKQAPVAFALERHKKQQRPDKADHLNPKII